MPFWSTCLLIRMWSPTARLGWPGPPLNSSRVLAPLFGPEPMLTSAARTGAPEPGAAGAGGQRGRPPTGCRSGAALLDSTWPASVVTAPPAAFWNGSGMSTFCWLGHSRAAPTITATPIATSIRRRSWPPTDRAETGRAGCVKGVRVRHPEQGRGRTCYAPPYCR